MNFKKRRGFALIWVVLIGALIFAGIVSLTLKVIPENMITIARTHTQRALSVAEDGTSQVLFDLRNFGTSTDPNYINEFDPNSGSTHYLTTGNVITLINASSGTIAPAANPSPFITNPTPLSDEIFETSFQSKIKVISNTYSDEGGVRTGTLNVSLYTLGTVSNRANENVLARKAIETSFQVEYKKEDTSTEGHWETESNSSVFDYALLSGADILFGGSAQTVEGNIHAIGTIDLGTAKNQYRVGNEVDEENGIKYDAEGEVKIQGVGKVTGKSLQGNEAPKIPFPEINIPAYETLANAFKTGTVPFDGSVSGFPNTNSAEEPSIIQLVIQSYLGAPNVSSTVSEIQSFYNDLMNNTGPFLSLNPSQISDLQTNIKAAVFYVDADSPLNGGNGDGTIQSNEEITINGNYSFQGTIVINGILTLNGNATIGDVNNPGGSAILVNGDIDTSKLTGTAALYGAYYSNGSITGKGTFDCYGSIVTKGSIDLKGNYGVTYVPINNPNLGVTETSHWVEGDPGAIIYSITSAVSSTSSYSWKEISYDGFVNAE